MANNFYTPTGSPTTRATASSANMRAEFAAIGTAFDKLPALTANPYKITYVNGAGTALAAAQEFYIDAAGGVSIGTSSAAGFLLHLAGSRTALRASYDVADAFCARTSFVKGRAGADLQNSDQLGDLQFMALSSDAGSHRAARMVVFADAAHTPTSKPGRMQFYTTKPAETEATVALVIDSAQKTTIPTGDLEVTAGKIGAGRTAQFFNLEVRDAAHVIGNSAGSNSNMYFGRVTPGSDGYIGSCGGANSYFLNTVQGDMVVGAQNNSLWLGSNSVGRVKIDTSGNVALQTDGASLRIKEGGTGATMGLANLLAGSAVVSTTAIASNSRVLLTPQTTGASPGHVRVSARSAGANFTITSSSGADTAQVMWIIFNPS